MNEDWTSNCISNIDHSFIEEADKYFPRKARQPYIKSVLINFAVVAIGVAIVLIIALVYPPREYKLVEEDGTYYMYIDKRYVSEDFLSITIYPTQEYYAIPFETLDEMLSALHHGTFTVHDFSKLGHFANSEGKIKLFDIEHLYDAVFPENLPDHDVQFLPNEYLFCIDDEDSRMKITLDLISEENFQHHLSRLPGFESTVVIPADASDANAIRDDACWQESTCCYIITAENTTYYVMEQYNGGTSSEIPASIEIYAKTTDGTYFSVRIYHYGKRPEITWLAQFGCKPYEP